MSVAAPAAPPNVPSSVPIQRRSAPGPRDTSRAHASRMGRPQHPPPTRCRRQTAPLGRRARLAFRWRSPSRLRQRWSPSRPARRLLPPAKEQLPSLRPTPQEPERSSSQPTPSPWAKCLQRAGRSEARESIRALHRDSRMKTPGGCHRCTEHGPGGSRPAHEGHQLSPARERPSDVRAEKICVANQEHERPQPADRVSEHCAGDGRRRALY